MKIENRTFIVSGGASGLGLATMQELLRANAYVSILDTSTPPLCVEQSTSSLSSPNPRLVFFRTDIAKYHEVERAVHRTVAWTKTTGAALGGVINCAGIGTYGKIIDGQARPHPLDLWNYTIAVNLTGSFTLTRLVLESLVDVPLEEGERGVIIFTSSSAAYEGQPGQTAYAASKGALRSLTRPLARHLARHNIRVNAIAPGAFLTPMTDEFPARIRANLVRDGVLFPKRFGIPREFARTVVWVLECGDCNGETVRLTGGGRVPAWL